MYLQDQENSVHDEQFSDAENSLDKTKLESSDSQPENLSSEEETPKSVIATSENTSDSSTEESHYEIPDYNHLSKEELVIRLEEILNAKQVHEIRREVEAIKINFYKKHRADTEIKRKKYVENGGLIEEFEVPQDAVEEKISELLKKYRDLRM